MKTYVVIVSCYFPKNHQRTGEKTNFSQKLQLGIKNIPNSVMYNEECDLITDRKIHTIRSNYPLWSKRISKIQTGEATLSIRYWSGKPYNSKQIEICKLDKNSGVGVQELDLSVFKELGMCFINYNELTFSGSKQVNHKELAKNDGLSLKDFKEWFKDYDLSQSMAIIHFTSFRY